MSGSLGKLVLPGKFGKIETNIYRFIRIVNKKNQSNLTQTQTMTPFYKEEFFDPRTTISIMSVLSKKNYRTT